MSKDMSFHVARALRDANKRRLVEAYNEAERYANSSAGVYRVPPALSLAEQERKSQEQVLASACRQVPGFRDLLCHHLVMRTQPCKPCGRTPRDAQAFASEIVAAFSSSDDN